MQEAGAGVSTVTTPGERHAATANRAQHHRIASPYFPLSTPYFNFMTSITTKTKRCIALRSHADAALPAQKQQSHNLIRCFSNAVCLEAHTCSYHFAIGVEARTLDPLLTTH